MSGHRITAKGKQWKAPLFFFAVFLCAFLSAQGGRTAAAKAQEETGLCNVVVFLRFQGESEFLSGTPQVPSILQKDGTTVNLADSYRDVDHYFQKISDGACPVDTLFLTADPSGQTAASYEVPHPRSYYLPYSASNPQGVPSSGNERFNREMDLLENALKAVLASLPENISLDRDGDGKIDNITFLACGSPSASSQVIWPHRWALQKNKITAADSSGEEKLAYDYNFTFADSRYSGVGVLCHELLHTLGFPDLYREGDKTGGVPVGGWDVMGSEDKDNPQYPCAYLSKAYGGWGRIEEISGSGLYTLRPLGTDDGSPDAYAIPTEDPNEFLMAEYRKNSPGIQGDNVPRDGLLLYRVNRLTSSGNIHGSPAGGDEVYVYRPGDASPNAGTQRRLSEAALGSQWGVSSYGSASPSAPAVETLYLSSGENTGIVISRVSEQEDGTLTFHVALPEDENRIEPGSYDLSLRDYTIAEPGEYRFTGSTSEHSVTVTGKARDVSIILENVEIDLREKENSSPILLRAGTQASLQTEGNCLLQGGANAPAVRVREGASLTVSGPGSLTVSGGAGAAAIGGNTQETAGSLAFSGADVTAVGGGAYQQQGIAALLETGPAPAIGAGADGRCGDIRLENTKLRGRSGSGAAVSTGPPGKTPGGSLTVNGGGIWGDGGLCGGSLSCENAVISISRSARSDFGCLEAENSIALHGCEVEIESMAGGSAVGSRSRKPQVKISGGSFRAFSKDCTICASSAALGEDTRFSLGTQEEEILYVGENAEGKPYEAQPGIAQGASGRAVLLQGTLEAPLPGEDELRLMGESVEKTAHPLPSGCRTGAFSAPLETEFYLQNRSGERSQFLRVTRDGITRIPLEFSRQDSPYRELDLSSRSVTVTESGEYRVHGAFSERSITVEAGLQVTLHLEGLTLTAPSDTAAVSAKAGSDLTLVLESPWENELSGGTGKPALDVDGSLAITGSGALSALGGKGAAAISAGTVALGPDSRLFAAGGGSSAVLRREAAEEDGWNLPGKPAPRLLMGGLQRSFSGATELFFRGGEELERYLVPSGTKSFFVTVSGSAPRTLIANTSAASPALDCTAGVNSYENVAFTSWSTSARSVDLSQGDVEITENGTYRISGSTSRYTVTVADEVVATLILDGAQIRVTQAEFLEGKRGLIELGENTLATLSFPSFGQASALANRVPESTCGIVYVPRSSRLTVNGSQTLAVMPGEEAMLFGARDGEEAGAVTLRSGEIDCGLSPGSTSQTLLGGRHSRVSLESGSLTVTGGPCGAVGGDSSRVSLSGGSLTLSGGSPSGTVGGAGALVTVTGGVLSLDLKSGCIGLGGSSSVVDIRGGEMTVSDVSNVSGGMLAGLGGSHSLLRLDGGSVQIDSLRKSGSGGALGGENARMELSAQGKLAVRLKQRSNAPLAGNVQENFSASGGLLDVRLASAFSSGSRVLLRNRETDEITAEVFLPPSYYGFFLPLPSGVYDLLTPSGACGGSVEIQPGKIASLENVRFDRLAGVWLADGEAEYDGTPHSLSLSGSLPEDASVSYEGNGAIEPGEYPVTASISADGISYTLTATLTVKKAPLTATGVFPADKPVYDGSCETGGTLSLSGAKGEDTPEATARFRFADPDVGTAKPVLVSDIVLLPEWDSRYELVIPEDVLSGAAASVLEKAEAKVTLHRKGSGFAVSTVPAGLSCPITYGGETEPPQSPGLYPVAAVVEDKNYAGSAQDVLAVGETLDLSQGDISITSPGVYRVTGKTDRFHITVDCEPQAPGAVILCLEDASIDLRETSGIPLDAVSPPADGIRLLLPGGTETTLLGGAGQPALRCETGTLNISGTGLLRAYGGQEAQAVSGQLAWENAPHAVLFSTLSQLPENLPEPCISAVFASPALEDAVFSLVSGDETQEFTILCGYQTAVFSQAADHSVLCAPDGQALRTLTPESPNAQNVPFSVEELPAYSVNLTEQPEFTIRENGVYHIAGWNEEVPPHITVAPGVCAVLLLEEDGAPAGDAAPLILGGAGAQVTLACEKDRTLSGLSGGLFQGEEGASLKISGPGSLSLFPGEAQKESPLFDGKMEIAGPVTVELASPRAVFSSGPVEVLAGGEFSAFAEEEAAFRISQDAVPVWGASLFQGQVSGSPLKTGSLLAESPQYPDWREEFPLPEAGCGSFLFLLPGPGDYTFTHQPESGEALTAQANVLSDVSEAVLDFQLLPEISGLSLESRSWVYDGTEKFLTVAGAPEGVEIVYENNGQTRPGEYSVAVRAYRPGFRTTILTGELAIEKRLLTVSVSAEDKEVYDGSLLTTGTVRLGNFVAGQVPQAAARFAFDTPDVGERKTVFVTDIALIEDENRWSDLYRLEMDSATTTASVKNKASVTLSFLSESMVQEYGGVTGPEIAAPQGLSVVVSFENGAVPSLPGEYPVSARVENPNYQGSAAGLFTVTPKTLHLTGIRVPELSQNSSDLEVPVMDSGDFDAAASGVLPGDEVLLNYTASYPSRTPGTHSVPLSNLTLSGAQAALYQVSDAGLLGTGQVPRPASSGGAPSSEPDPPEPPEEQLPFLDTSGHWAEADIRAVYELGLMNGTGQDLFQPNAGMSRAMLVTVLCRMAGGEPGPIEDSPYPDVPASSWYAPYVAWATEQGLAHGMGDGFHPHETVSREQFALFLYRLAQYQGESTALSAPVPEFADGETISSWAREAMDWAVDRGILQGRDHGLLDPRSPATRAETAAMLHRYLTRQTTAA